MYLKKDEEDILLRSKFFEKINEYAIELSSLSYNDIFPQIAKSIKQFFEIEEVFISLYDEKNSELITNYSTFTVEENHRFSKYLGRKIIGLRSPVNEEAYHILTSRTLSVVHSLNEVTFGKIPDSIGKLIEKVYGLGWFVGISLMQRSKLIGAIVLVGKKDRAIPESTILETFIKITTTEIVRKKVEVELLESEERFKALHNASFGGIAIHDKGIILDCNHGLSEMFGYSVQELIGMNGLLLIAPQDRDFVINKIEIGYEKPYEAYGIGKNGEQFPMRLEARKVPYKGKHVRTVEFRDLTERKKAEKELLIAKEKAEKNEQMFKSLIENAPDGVSIIDLEGNLKYASPNAARHFGYDFDDFLGHSGTEFTHPDDIPLVIKTFETIMKDPSLKPKIIYRFRRKDGEYRWIETTFTNLLSNKFINGFILNFNDITERKKAEEALLRSEAKLSALFSSMSEMVVLHELVFDSDGNPVNYRITDCNVAFTRITGITRESAVGKLSTEVYGSDNPPYLDEFSKVALSGIPYHYDTYFNPLEKHFSISVVSPEEYHFATVTTDITEQKRAELLIQDKSEEIAVQNEELNIANQELIATIARAEQNEANVTAIIEGTQNSIWAFNRNYEILYINNVMQNEFQKSFGVSLIKGSNLIDSLPEYLRSIWKPRYDRVLANEQYTVEDGVDTDFGKLYIQVTFNPIIKNGVVIGGSCFGSNITERKQAEKDIIKAKEKAEESEMQFRNLFENASDAIFIAEEETGIIVDVNLAAENLMQIERNLLIGLHQSQLHPPEQEEFSRGSFINHRIKRMDDHIPLFINNDVVRKDGSRVPVEVLANKLMYRGKKCLVGTFRDISERRNAEIQIIKAKEKIEESEENLRFLFENMIQGVVYHKPSGEIIKANEAAARILGLSLDQLYGKTSFDSRWKTIHEDKSNFLAEEHPVMMTIKTKKSVINQIMGVFIPEKNDYSWININSIPKFNDKNELIQIVVTFEDITEIRNAKEKAQENDKLKTAFLQNMSHEIRTPLNGIIGFSNLLQETNLLEQEINEYTSIISQSGKRLLEIINNVLDISKIETGQMSVNNAEFSINSTITKLFTFFSPLANAKNIKLNNKTLSVNSNIQIISDETRINQILTNLINNAIKFTYKGSVDVGFEIIDNQIHFFVKDTGIGIAPEFHNKIFDRFTQIDLKTTRGFEGAGLGLAISKGLVEMLGGRMWFESIEGIGSTFYFSIPYNCEQHSETKSVQIDTLENNIDTGKLKILIAEDDKVSEMLISKYIKLMTKEILKVRTGIDAVEVCRNNPDIDLVLMDIRMPDLGGFEATKQIREFNKNVIIFAQTAYGFTGDREKSIDSGCNDYIAKPIDKDELLALINKYFKSIQP